MSKSRLFYIDNLRIFLISLVVLHHLAITYGAPGGWYYNESQAEFPEIIPLSMFVATNQAFFMGMFFFVSAFFIVPSLNRKGTRKFVKERLFRLGIPLIIFYFLISPFAVFLRIKFIDHQDHTFLDVLKNGWGMGFGPMWFVEALLIFTAVFLLLKSIKKINMKFPTSGKIVVFAFIIGVGQFIIRIWLPVGWSLPGTGLQFPHFLQYIFLFAFGIIACQNNWMDKVNSKKSWRWFIFSQVLIFIGFPLIFVLGGATDGSLDAFMGGLTRQCFAYTLWEQLLGFSLILALFGIFKKKVNKQRSFANMLSESAYGVYVFHTPVLLGISAIFLNWQIPQLLKFIVLAPVALLSCFIVAWVAKQIPGINSVL